MNKYTQRDISEIMFHYHLDQAASHMQSMRVSLPLTHEVKHDFNMVRTIMNRIWRKQDEKIQVVKAMFEDEASKMDAFLQLFLQCNDQEQLLNTIRQHQQAALASKDAMIINRQLVEHQQRSLHQPVSIINH